MKIIRKEHSESAREFWKKLNVVLFHKWYTMVGVVIIAFGLGAWMYREGNLDSIIGFSKKLLRESPIAALRSSSLLSEAADSITNEVRLYQNNGLSTLEIDLKFEDYQKLLDKRSEALQIGILNSSDSDYVDGKIVFQHGKKLDAELRLKGDWTDHLEGDKWSFKIKLKEDGQVLSMREFSIQSPATRNFLNEWAFHRALMDEGVLTTRYEFVNVILNGKNLGVYAIEDSFTPELIESQGRRQGVIIRFNEDLMWNNLTTFWSNNLFLGGSMMATNVGTAEILPFKESKIASDPILSQDAEKARELLSSYQMGNLPVSEVFDVELMGKFFAMSDLWSACHGTEWHNLRFFYNPINGLLEPLAYDNEPFSWCSQDQSIITEFIDNGQSVFREKEVRAAYARELERLSQPENLDALKQELEEEEKLYIKAMRTEFYADDDVGVNWDQLKIRGKVLSLELQPSQPIRGSYQLSLRDDFTLLAVDLVNLMLLPVEIEAIEVNGIEVALPQGSLYLDPILDPEKSNRAPERFDLNMPSDLFEGKPPVVIVLARIVGLERVSQVELSGTKMPDEVFVGVLPQQPTIEEALLLHPFLNYNPEKRQLLVAKTGVWDVQGDLILPEDTDLFVEAGAVLRFGEGNILYGTGSVRFLGEEDAPVVLTAKDDTWGGVFISNTERDSYWRYAIVEKTGGISRDGWILTGGITFYKATLQADQVVLGNNETEDAINFVHGSFSIHNSEFINTFADALDSDFSSGEIVNCSFREIAGDAIDVSGTRATVKDSQMKSVADKGVSVGENSRISIDNLLIDTVGIGVASKDLSSVIVNNTEIRNARFAALAAYIKKPVYGPASIEATNLTILNTETDAVAQEGSTILLNGEIIQTIELDVDKLYAEGLLGN